MRNFVSLVLWSPSYLVGADNHTQCINEPRRCFLFWITTKKHRLNESAVVRLASNHTNGGNVDREAFDRTIYYQDYVWVKISNSAIIIHALPPSSSSIPSLFQLACSLDSVFVALQFHFAWTDWSRHRIRPCWIQCIVIPNIRLWTHCPNRVCISFGAYLSIPLS